MFDLHCHILFDVDDGSKDLAESQAMLNAARASGIDTIVCTPHCRGSHFDYQRIVDHFEVLSAYARSQGFEMTLGFEVFWENLVSIGLENAPKLCFEGTDLLLLEFGVGSLPPNWQRIIYNLRGQGIQPIIAHPERYRPVQNDLDLAVEMKDLGCLLQLSGNFASGGFRSGSKKTALKLLENDLVDYIASDAHCVADYEDYRKALKIAQRY
ncbi:tyrosine-protein phosphatase [Arabiibacter massiliensis]|uniref:tyrosine-protein phosphatase n=1 Tax=Arabiibacter massiliensis TaxID=1870985 RepID=UPI0009BC0EF1|nr:CpsB/CapC family capsule biosynthesis tyrosine phosphatase [Arabiibacter massiliensis]